MPVKPKPTKTINSLHFEDLEPHRFEDLVRQLAYQFKDWAEIEAIGRTGSDEGSDTRAYEVSSVETADTVESDDESPVEPAPQQRRLWHIQCKRQMAFGPADARKAVQAVVVTNDEPVYGLIVAAPANVSLATRRAYAQAARDHGFEELYLWGKGELEDQLILPQNDHLLFAYFGISLQVRRRSQKSEQRAVVTLKRQLVRVLGGVDQEHYQEVLLRSPANDGYPFVGDRKRFKRDRLWWYYRFVEHWPPNNLLFELHRIPAFINRETGEWDAIFAYDLLEEQHNQLWGIEPSHFDPAWQKDREAAEMHRLRYMRFFNELPEEQQAHISVHGLLPYERILAVDELGDRVNRGPHLVVAQTLDGHFFDESPLLPKVEPVKKYWGKSFYALEELRVERFPKEFPKLTKEQYTTILEEQRKRWMQQSDPDPNG